MIKFAENNMLSDLKDLWKKCFFVDFYSPYGVFYITNIFNNYKPLVYITEDKIISMLTLMPVNLISKNDILSGFYIYGLGTLPEYRNKNIASEMLTFVDWYSKKLNKDFNILIPADNNKSLYDFYFKRGFSIDIKYRISLLDRQQLWQCLNINSKILKFKLKMESCNLKKLRQQNYCNIDFIEWEIKELDIIQKEYSLPNGNHYLLNFDNNQYAIIDLRDKLILRIREFYIFKENISSFIKTLLYFYKQYNFFEFSFPNNDIYINFANKYIIKNIAMLKQINSKVNHYLDTLYFNFGLDT